MKLSSLKQKRHRAKSAYEKDPNVSIDIIGQPRESHRNIKLEMR